MICFFPIQLLLFPYFNTSNLKFKYTGIIHKQIEKDFIKVIKVPLNLKGNIYFWLSKCYFYLSEIFKFHVFQYEVLKLCFHVGIQKNKFLFYYEFVINGTSILAKHLSVYCLLMIDHDHIITLFTVLSLFSQRRD